VGNKDGSLEGRQRPSNRSSAFLENVRAVGFAAVGCHVHRRRRGKANLFQQGLAAGRKKKNAEGSWQKEEEAREAS